MLKGILSIFASRYKLETEMCLLCEVLHNITELPYMFRRYSINNDSCRLASVFQRNESL